MTSPRYPENPHLPNTMKSAWWDLGRAVDDLVDAVARALHLDAVVARLATWLRMR